MICIKNAHVVLESSILADGAILIDGERIVSVGPCKDMPLPPDCTCIDAGGAYVGPGFVDIHVHGGGEAMFYEDPEKAAAHFLAHGETTQLATLYYDLDKASFAAAIDRIKDAMAHGTAAKAIAGEHDFRAFKSAGVEMENTVRTVFSSEWTKVGPYLYYDISGNGFLYNMVRILVGTMIDIGKGVLSADAIERALLSCDRADAGATAPAQGLTLCRVRYHGFDTEEILRSIYGEDLP